MVCKEQTDNWQTAHQIATDNKWIENSNGSKQTTQRTITPKPISPTEAQVGMVLGDDTIQYKNVERCTNCNLEGRCQKVMYVLGLNWYNAPSQK